MKITVFGSGLFCFEKARVVGNFSRIFQVYGDLHRFLPRTFHVLLSL